jgi:hypothetical protein
VLQYRNQQLIARIIARSKHLLLQQQARRAAGGSLAPQRVGLAAVVGLPVAVLDMQQLASDIEGLVASSGVTSDKLGAVDARMLWEVHAWLVQHQLLNGQGLAGLLSQQQLEQGRAAAEAYHAQKEQQQAA